MTLDWIIGVFIAFGARNKGMQVKFVPTVGHPRQAQTDA